mgnify:CR=1 FL=1
MNWYVYIVKCVGDSLYTGITTDIRRRIEEHNLDNKLGAKSLRNKRPVKLVYYEIFENQTQATKREREIKGWNRQEKLNLIEGFTLSQTKGR